MANKNTTPPAVNLEWTEKLATAVGHLETKRSEARTSEKHLRQTIRDASADGVHRKTIATATHMSESRIYQIIAGTRGHPPAAAK